MTTATSPIAVIRTQAEGIAKALKAAERGEIVANDPAGKIAASLDKGEITFGIVMDDKMIKVTMPWEKIRSTSEIGIIEFIISHMREEKAS